MNRSLKKQYCHSYNIEIVKEKTLSAHIKEKYLKGMFVSVMSEL